MRVIFWAMVLGACQGDAGPMGDPGAAGAQGAMGTMGTPGAMGVAGPGQVWEDATGAVIPGSFWIWDQGNVQMGITDEVGNFYRVMDPAAVIIWHRTIIDPTAYFANTGCTGEAYYERNKFPRARLTFRFGPRYRAMADDELGSDAQIRSYRDPNGSCIALAATMPNMVSLTALDALPTITLPDLSAYSPLFHPAITN